MKIHYNIDDFAAKNTVLTIGSFDGVHLGHQKVLNELISFSQVVKSQSVVMIFWPHPRTVLSPHGKDFKLINTIDERIKLLAETGIDHLIIYPFDFKFSKLTTCLFIEKILAKKLNVKYFLMGFNQRFGSDRVSDIEQITICADIWGIQVKQLSSHSARLKISSTDIRDALFNGKIKYANQLLSYKYFIKGQVVGGNKIGRTIHFPTANIQIKEHYKLIPPDGVYVVRILIDNILYNGVLNIGLRPTINGRIKTIETHIFNFEENIYGKTIKIIFEKWLRGEKRFENLQELKLQLKIDKKICQDYFAPPIDICIAPDSFKGSIDSIKAARILSQAATESVYNFKTKILPLADGGEGSIDILKYHKKYLVKVGLNSKDPVLKSIKTYYYADMKHNIAFIEFAKAGGLNLLKIQDQNPMNTTSYGVGLFLKDAIEKMFQTIILFVGGSATNDAGLGILYALGAKFSGVESFLIPMGENLNDIKNISFKKNFNAKIIVASDVTNVYYGENGATKTYARQKGASDKEILQLEAGMRNIHQIVYNDKNIRLNRMKGSGAAGGVSGILHAYLNAEIVSGAELIFKLINLDKKIKQCALIITGEGRIDAQTGQGKLICRLNKQALKQNIPIWAISGFCSSPEKQKSMNRLWHISCLASTEEEKEKTILKADEELKKHFLKEINKVMHKLVIK